jgi:hypothetical protein
MLGLMEYDGEQCPTPGNVRWTQGLVQVYEGGRETLANCAYLFRTPHMAHGFYKLEARTALPNPAAFRVGNEGAIQHPTELEAGRPRAGMISQIAFRRSNVVVMLTWSWIGKPRLSLSDFERVARADAARVK